MMKQHRTWILCLGVILMAGAASCDEARVEYAYQLPNPVPTMPPPQTLLQSQGTKPPVAPVMVNQATPANADASGLPAKEAGDFLSALHPGAGTREVTVAGLTFSVPESWEDQTAGRPMRAAEFSIPAADGAGSGEFILFHFGPGQGGTADANAARWLAQFSAEDGSAAPRRLVAERDDLSFTLLTAEGRYTPTSMGPNAPAQDPRPGSRLLGLIVEGGPQGTAFFRITGPRATMAAAESAVRYIAASMRPEGEAAPALKPSAVVRTPTPEEGGPLPSTIISGATQSFTAAGYVLTPPVGWERTEPTSSMRLAEFVIPSPYGDEAKAATMVLFHFGAGSGGGAEDNIERWKRQFTANADGSAPSWDVETRTRSNGLKQWILTAEGTYTAVTMGGPPADPMPGQRLFGIILEGGPQGSLFIRAVGPAATMRAWEGDLRKMADGAGVE